jgi:hypothetical protein
MIGFVNLMRGLVSSIGSPTSYEAGYDSIFEVVDAGQSGKNTLGEGIGNESDAYIHSIEFCHMGCALAFSYCISYCRSCRPDRQGLNDSDKAGQIGSWILTCSIGSC